MEIITSYHRLSDVNVTYVGQSVKSTDSKYVMVIFISRLMYNFFCDHENSNRLVAYDN